VFVRIVDQQTAQALLDLPAGLKSVKIVAVHDIWLHLDRKADGVPPKARYLNGQTPTGAKAGLDVLDPNDPDPVAGFFARQLTMAIPTDHGHLMPMSGQGPGLVIDPGVGTKRIGKDHDDPAQLQHLPVRTTYPLSVTLSTAHDLSRHMHLE
jgi:hypothetical protein